MTREYSSKPDPENPWRWVCPECHEQVYRTDSEIKFRCRTCGGTWARGELVDQAEL